MSKIDLHIHSAASDDGEYTPQELVAMCTAQGMELIAVTDHNSVPQRHGGPVHSFLLRSSRPLRSGVRLHS